MQKWISFCVMFLFCCFCAVGNVYAAAKGDQL